MQTLVIITLLRWLLFVECCPLPSCVHRLLFKNHSKSVNKSSFSSNPLTITSRQKEGDPIYASSANQEFERISDLANFPVESASQVSDVYDPDPVASVDWNLMSAWTWQQRKEELFYSINNQQIIQSKMNMISLSHSMLLVTNGRFTLFDRIHGLRY